MSTVSQQQVYGAGTGTTQTPAPVITTRDPNGYDVNYPVGKVWINKVAKNLFYLNGFNSQTGIVLADWINIADVQANIAEYNVVLGGPDNSLTSTGPGSAGQVLQSGGAFAYPQYSTAAYPTTTGGTGTFIQSVGVDYINSGYKLPTATPANGIILQSNGTDILGSTYTLPTTAGAAGHILQSSGSGYIDCTLNAGTGISLSNISGNITINSNAPSVQSYFVLFLSTTQANCTGNNVDFLVPFDVVQTNVGSNYDPLTYIYTAPAAGMYTFSAAVRVLDFSVANNCDYALLTIYRQNPVTPVFQRYPYALYSSTTSTSGDNCTIGGSVTIYLGLGDKVTCNVQVQSTAQNVGVQGLDTAFAGYNTTYFTGKYLG